VGTEDYCKAVKKEIAFNVVLAANITPPAHLNAREKTTNCAVETACSIPDECAQKIIQNVNVSTTCI